MHRIYNSPLPVIGLTGGVASGKSEVANIFFKMGLPLIMADQLVKKIYKKPSTIRFCQHHFKNSFKDGQIDFYNIRQEVFNKEEKRTLLEDLIHPQLGHEFLLELRKIKKKKFVIYEIPLLFEKRLKDSFDLTICVYAPRELQVERLLKRDKMEQPLALKMLESQISIDEKRSRSDLTILNQTSFADLQNEVSRVLETLKKEFSF